MSTFSTPIVEVLSVEDHPNADRLSIVKVLGYTCISGKLPDGSHRYKAGDRIVYIPSASVLPEWLLRDMDFWNEEKNMGGLAGSNGDRVKPLRLRGIYSEGVLYPVDVDTSGEGDNFSVSSTISIPNDAKRENGELVFDNGREDVPVNLGDDVSGYLGITKYEPPIPAAMAGQVANLSGHTIKYDFERWETVPDMFDNGEHVVATEKLHGTFCAISFIPGLNHPEMFGTNGEIIVHSKGLGSQGLAFKNILENDNNIYVKTLRELLKNNFENTISATSRIIGVGTKVTVVGEIFGKGIQDLNYGLDKPTFRVFDICVGYVWLTPDAMKETAKLFLLDTVPELYQGPFDLEALIVYRDGKTVLGNGANVREGIVVRSADEVQHPIHGRKIAKMISPDYLLRKAKDATEFN